MTKMTITFTSHNDEYEYSDELYHEVTTTINLWGNICLHLVHGFRGVGLSDRTEKYTFIDCFRFGKNINHQIARQLDIELDNNTLPASAENLHLILQHIKQLYGQD